MGSAGLQWDAGDIMTQARLNQKMNFVGTGAQIAALTTYAGMIASCTSTGSGFTINHYYVRDATNASWLEFATLSEAQTVLNKTIVLANNTLTDTSAATGDIPKHNGTRFVRLGMGTANQVLRVNAGATDLEYSAISGVTSGTDNSSGSAGASTTAYSAAIGSATRSIASTSSVVVVHATGVIYNNGQNGNNRDMIVAIDDGTTQVKTLTVSTGTTVGASNTYRPFHLVYAVTGISGSKTFSVKVANATNNTDSDTRAQNVLVQILEFKS